MFWGRIRLWGREYLGVLDTGATISILAKKTLPCGDLKNIMLTAATRMDGGGPRGAQLRGLRVRRVYGI